MPRSVACVSWSTSVRSSVFGKRNWLCTRPRESWRLRRSVDKKEKLRDNS